MRELALVRGIETMKFSPVSSKEVYARKSMDILLENDKIKVGDLLAFIGGTFGDCEEPCASYMEFKYVKD